MANIHGLFSGKKNEDDDDDSEDDEHNHFVGGIGNHGGGSGLAVKPNTNDNDDKKNSRDAIFGMAKAASGDDKEQIRRKITMYKGGFTVDDGPYRRLDDPANAEFLMALASGRTPPELAAEDTVVGLVDKRGEDYVETFQSFSGTGASLGSSNNSSDAAGVVFPPATSPPPTIAQPDTRIAVRLANGQRHIVKLNSTTNTVADLAAQLPADTPFRLVSGFPPQPLLDASATIAAAGLKGAQVSMQSVDA